MARKDPHSDVSRRKFLAGVAVTGAAVTATNSQAGAAAPPTATAKLPTVLPPSAQQIAAETEVPKDASARRPRRFRFHGRRHQGDRHRLHVRQSGIELPRSP